jgi:hypothetical protein
MSSLLKHHPFAVEAFFKSSLVLSFAVPKKELSPLIPECLEIDSLNDTYGFFTLAMVQTQSLRPKGFPSFMGNNFFLIGYRIFVKYVNREGKRLRGLYILGSQTDKKKMEIFGNLFTHYNYTTTDISIQDSEGIKRIVSERSGIDVLINTTQADIALPANSPFEDWQEARRFAGPLPFTFTYDQSNKKVTIIEGVRENWKPEPVQVLQYKVGFLNRFNFSSALLANAFEVRDIPYHWKKGRTELWKQ